MMLSLEHGISFRFRAIDLPDVGNLEFADGQMAKLRKVRVAAVFATDSFRGGSSTS